MRLRALLASAVLAFACAAAPAETAVPPPHAVQDPHYGDGLFQFFQEHYFTALTGLMVSQHFERMPSHADEAEVLRGGLLLSYGLHRQAGDIFTALIDKGAAPPVRDRAWFFLAKIRYQRGLLDEAQAAVDRIGDHLPAELADDRLLLAANILMARGDHARAAALLERAPQPQPAGVAATVTGWLPNSIAAWFSRSPAGMTATAGNYARFNLGVALVKSGQPERGRKLLDTLGQTGAADEEMRSLRDKANLALGFDALQNDQPQDARAYLERVRLQGPQANKALLGFGWAAASLKEPKLALVPWVELAGRDASDTAVLEARIAVPYAYAQTGAWRQALKHYQQAVDAYDREGRTLDESIVAVRAGRLVDGLVAKNPGEEMGWFWPIKQLPAMPHAGHLATLLSQHSFQEAFKNYRDLQFLARNLQEWQDKLGLYDDMLATRRAAYAERLPDVRAKARETGLGALAQRRDALAAEQAQAEAAQDGVAYADARQQALAARLADVRQAATDPDIAERVRRVAGALTWELAQTYSARAWDAKKGLKAVDDALAEARRRDAAITAAQRDEPARFDRYAQRTAALAARIRALQPQVTALAEAQQQQLQALAVDVLQAQKERLAVYTVQARYAIAQLYDRATDPTATTATTAQSTITGGDHAAAR